MNNYDCVIVGSGPAGFGTAFELLKADPSAAVLILEKAEVSTGGLRNDCKMNFSWPIGFPTGVWQQDQAESYLERVIHFLKPDILAKHNLGIYSRRAARLGVQLMDIRQTHLGTDGGLELIRHLTKSYTDMGGEWATGEEMTGFCDPIDGTDIRIQTTHREIKCKNLVLATGRGGFRFLQSVMDDIGIPYIDHIVDIGVRIELKEERYPIVQDYYDPKFVFPRGVRTFCTNSRSAYVVRERYTNADGQPYFSVNGHAWSEKRAQNGLANFAMLKTVRLTEPLASGQDFAEMLGLQAMLLGGGKPLMQRIGDFRLGKRSKTESFNGDLYDFEPTLKGCTPGDVSLAMPAKILREIWKALKSLDTIIPGVLHPSTIIYYPEIKLYANKPTFRDDFFQVSDNIYMIGDGAGTSRGITAAWASGIRAADGIRASGN